MNLGNALQSLGARESGTVRLEQAVQAYRLALEEFTRERVPLQWATTQMNLGSALQTLGERESGTARLEQAVQAYRLALEEFTRERVPLQWATTQMNLGNALRDPRRARKRHRAPRAGRPGLPRSLSRNAPASASRSHWAETQMNLGNALLTLGERESGTERLEQAIQVYRLALQEFTALHAPYYRTVAEQNLSKARQLLEQRSGRGQRDR